MIKEILEGEDFERGRKENLVIKRLEKAVAEIDGAIKLTKDLKEGARLKKILDKCGEELFEEMEFVGHGEYS
ncbi:MAG: hypothetical protein KAI79_17200 [Bacteroidales bacterium]|nr:hypothetical protein [Bacteroidales bacterium]